MTPSTHVPQPGQRWTSELEPELGLGIVDQLDSRTVTLRFPASDAVRRYALASAPIRRARFQVGDEVSGRDGLRIGITAVVEHQGLVTYRGDAGTIHERELADTISFSTPGARLASGRVDRSELFDLRLEILALQHRIRGSQARGFVGGRMELIPHQLYIASEVAARQAPRVLLADEVGLGKTIEAGLILHRLLVSGRIGRALILVPESLLHQWLVELLRRFNLRFSLFDDERCRAIAAERPGDNPFLEEQLVLASAELLSAHPRWGVAAIAAGWDILVVDEAHHLAWSETGASPPYALVERLAERVRGLLLLTATPEQLGLVGHFARLRLLDPDRYPDLDRFRKEADRYREVAALADRLQRGRPLDEDQSALLDSLLGRTAEARVRILDAASGDLRARDRILRDLVDRHGTGRVMLRNTRNVIRGFPSRRASVVRLPATRDPGLGKRLSREALAASPPVSGVSLVGDPRIPWLHSLLDELGEEKVLIICRGQATAQAIEAALKERVRIPTALFHERLTLIQRDRNAAFFADPEGARVLISSEIGSEGRNFQFVHHLVLFDLPIDPDLIEQRIGRLDRIGQKEDITIHVPWIAGSAQEALAAWHHDGLDAIATSLRGGQQLTEQFGARVRQLAQHMPGGTPAEIEGLVAEVRTERDIIERRLSESRDHLLEIASFDPQRADRLVREIRAADGDAALPELTLRLFEHLGVLAEEIGRSTYRLNPDALACPDFPELERGDTAITFDRERALAREDLGYLSWDHPLLVRAIEILLGSEAGNSAFARRPDAPDPLLLEAVFLLECVAPLRLQVDRFLPTTPILVVVDHRLADRTDDAALRVPGRLESRSGTWIAEQRKLSQELLPAMIDRGRGMAEERGGRLRADAIERARTCLGAEIERLRELARVNRNIRREEIALADEELALVTRHLAAARLRLDALRLITA